MQCKWLMFEGYERRMPQIQPVLEKYGFTGFGRSRRLCNNSKGVDAYKIVEGIQPICFENAKWAYDAGRRHRHQEGREDRRRRRRLPSARACRPSASPAPSPISARSAWATATWAPCCCDEETECFAFLAGHESFAAAEGAIGIARNANKVRKKPLRVILNGLGKDAAMIISRINGFTYVQTKYDYLSADVKEDHALTIVSKTAYSDRRARQGSAATARTTCARAWPSCGTRAWTFPSPATPPTPPASSIPVAGTYKK